MAAPPLSAEIQRDDMASDKPGRQFLKAGGVVHPAVQGQHGNATLAPPCQPGKLQPVHVPSTVSRGCHIKPVHPHALPFVLPSPDISRPVRELKRDGDFAGWT